MVQPIQVVEDGLERPAPKDKSVPGWLLLLLGFVVGIGFGSTFLATSSETGPEESAQTPIDAEGVGGAVPEDGGLSEIVLGFDHTLVAVARGSEDVVDLLIWPADGGVTTNAIRNGYRMSIDASGQHYAMLTPLPGDSDLLLSTGRYHSIVPKVTGVHSYAWHETTAGLLAFTTVAENGWHLEELLPSGRVEEVAGGPEAESMLVGWGEWGYALQIPGTGTLLLTPEGEIKDVDPGVVFSTSAGEWMPARDESFMLLSSGGGVQRIRVEEELGDVQNAAISPEGDLIAVVSASGLHVVTRAQASVIAGYEGPVVGTPTWSPDGRFVAVLGTRGAVVLDVVEDLFYPVFTDRALALVHLR